LHFGRVVDRDIEASIRSDSSRSAEGNSPRESWPPRHAGKCRERCVVLPERRGCSGIVRSPYASVNPATCALSEKLVLRPSTRGNIGNIDPGWSRCSQFPRAARVQSRVFPSSLSDWRIFPRVGGSSADLQRGSKRAGMIRRLIFGERDARWRSSDASKERSSRPRCVFTTLAATAVYASSLECRLSKGAAARWRRVLKEQKDERTGFRASRDKQRLPFPVEERNRLPAYRTNRSRGANRRDPIALRHSADNRDQ